MPEHSRSSPTPDNLREVRSYPADLTQSIQAELAALADITAQYEQKRQQLETWTGPQKLKERLAEQVEDCHKRDREPHVLRLGELHERIMALTMFRHLRTKH